MREHLFTNQLLKNVVHLGSSTTINKDYMVKQLLLCYECAASYLLPPPPLRNCEKNRCIDVTIMILVKETPSGNYILLVKKIPPPAENHTFSP